MSLNVCESFSKKQILVDRCSKRGYPQGGSPRSNIFLCLIWLYIILLKYLKTTNKIYSPRAQSKVCTDIE